MYPRMQHMRVIVAAIAAAFPLAAFGADDMTALKQQLEALKREVSELRTLMQQQTQKAATKEEVKAVQTEVSQVAKEQSSMLGANSIAHLSGYGAMGYADQKNSNGTFNTVMFNPIFHYQYKDLIFFETELETEVEPDGGTNVALEYANANLFINDYVSAFAGKFLSPVGYFFPNLHPAWINKFPSRPPGFGVEGSAAPESDVGVGVRGGFNLGGKPKANYVFYAGNGPRLELSAMGDEIEGVEAEGSTSNPDNSLVYGGRFGFLPIPHLEFGISGAISKVAVDLPGEGKRDYSAAGADASWEYRGLSLRGEYIQQKVDDLATSAAPQGGTWKTWYAQAAYRFPKRGWEPVLRYGDFNSPHADQSQRQWGLGLNYWFAPSAVGKIGYEFNSGETGTTNDDDRLMLQFAYGF